MYHNVNFDAKFLIRLESAPAECCREVFPRNGRRIDYPANSRRVSCIRVGENLEIQESAAYGRALRRVPARRSNTDNELKMSAEATYDDLREKDLQEDSKLDGVCVRVGKHNNRKGIESVSKVYRKCIIADA